MATAPSLTQIQQGATPASIGDIVNAIQNQYAGVQMPGNQGVSYGAARFLGASPTTVGLGTPTNTVAGVGDTAGVAAPSWFTPAPFDPKLYEDAVSNDTVAKAIETGVLNKQSGGFQKSLAEQYQDQYKADVYDPLFNPMPAWLPAVSSLFVPGSGLLFNAANTYAKTDAANNLINALQAYGVDAYEQSNPLTNTLMALVPFFGGVSDDVKGMESIARQFSTPESLFGYYDVATNPTVQSIFTDAYGQNDLSADQVGMIGNAISSRIQSYVADGMPLAAAEYQAAQDFGSTSIPQMVGYDPMGDLMRALNDPFSDVSLGIDQITYNTGSKGKNIGNGLVAYSDGSVRDQVTGGYVGGIVVDSSGNPVTSSDGTPVGWGVGVSPTYSGGSSSKSGSYSPNSMSSSSEVNARSESRLSRQEGVGDSDGGGSSSGGGKIVCTAMNEAYGFGSFRNRVWIKYARDHLTKAHEVGYHAIFLPLVDYGYKRGDGFTNKIVRSVLENIARHRGADLRAEMRGSKRDPLGRVYRAVLEPLCYLVGKIKGY